MSDDELKTSLDRMHFDKVLTNMFSNAIKYSEANVVVKVQKSENSFAVVVENDGSVVPMDMREKIFHPLVRYVSGNLNVPGTGLGLSIVKGILEIHGADYGVDSKLGEGSVFWFELPISAPPQPFLE